MRGTCPAPCIERCRQRLAIVYGGKYVLLFVTVFPVRRFKLFVILKITTALFDFDCALYLCMLIYNTLKGEKFSYKKFSIITIFSKDNNSRVFEI